MAYGYEDRDFAEAACKTLNEWRGDAVNKFVVDPYEIADDGQVLSWGVAHWYKPFGHVEAEWVLNGHMWTTRPRDEEVMAARRANAPQDATTVSDEDDEWKLRQEAAIVEAVSSA